MKRVSVVVAVAAAALCVAGTSVAVAAMSSPTSVKACVTGKGNLALRTAKGKCPRGSRATTIARTGPRGATGRTGATGKQGPRGPGALGLVVNTFASSPVTTVRTLTLPDRDTITVTCVKAAPGATEPTATVEITSASSAKPLLLVTGTMDIGNGTAQEAADDGSSSVTASGSDVHRMITRANTSSIRLRVTSPGANFYTRFTSRLLIAHGSHTTTADIGTLVADGCLTSVQATQSS